MGQLKIRYMLLTGAYCALIFYLSSQPHPPDLPISFPGKDKLAHGVLYAGLAATVWLGIRRSNETPNPWVQFWTPVVFAFLYGVTDETHQIFVPNRVFELADLAADTTGALVIQVCLRVIRGQPH